MLWSLSSPWSASRPYHLRVLADAQAFKYPNEELTKPIRYGMTV